MTRDDIFWILWRAAALYLIVIAVEAVPAAVQAFVDEVGIRQGSLSVVVPLVAAAVLFEISRRKSVDPARAVDITMSREDLLWVCCKVVGLWLLAQGATGVLTSPLWTGGASGSGAFAVFAVSGLVSGALGAWLFFGEQLWRWATGASAGAAAEIG